MPKSGGQENSVHNKTNEKKNSTQKKDTLKISNEKKEFAKRDKTESKIKKERENKIKLKTNTEKENKIEIKTKKSNKSEVSLPTEMSSHKKTKNINKKEFRTLEVVVLVFLTCLISLIIGGTLGMKFSKKSGNNKNIQIADAEIQHFIKEFNYLVENYYGDINKKELLNTAFKSMVDSLEDAYSGTLDENTSNNFDIELEGIYEGLGIEIVNDENMNILIYSIIPNSPASKSELQKGDKLITVNDVAVSGMTTTDFINHVIKGSKETQYTIRFERNGEQKDITIKKEYITLKSVVSQVYEEAGTKIGYLKVEIFAANTYEQFKKELQNLEKMGINSLIIDLRDNSGGHLTVVANMISLFLDSSHVIYQTQDKNGTIKVHSTGSKTKSYPIVIIGNSASASASELMIGALMEEYGATLIGNQSFGKGTIQELHKLSSGEEYKFTTKKWLTPKGNWIHEKGFKPSIEVTLSEEYYQNPIEENDNQLKAAKEYLKNLN